MTTEPRKTWKERARQLKRELYALMLAYKDRRVPWYARLFVICLLGYAFSPLDLIPDFVPILGYLDDLIVLPLGVLLAIKLIPPVVLEESRVQAEVMVNHEKPTNWIGIVVIILIWTLCAVMIGMFFSQWFF
jgi:uncharacterized membrane protein YkvA (DUF1232 family)